MTENQRQQAEAREKVKWVLHIGRRDDGEVVFGFEEGVKLTDEYVALLVEAAASLEMMISLDRMKIQAEARWWPDVMKCAHCGHESAVKEEPACYVIDCPACGLANVVAPVTKQGRA
jgi:ribosomal protein S27E